MEKLPESKYLPFFKEHENWLRAHTELMGDILIVERIVFPEKKIGSIYIADSKKQMVNGLTSELPTFFRVLYAGNGFYDDDTGEDVPLDIQRGDIILMAGIAVKVWSTFPGLEVTDSDVLGITKHGEIQWRWKGEEKFIEFLGSLNQSVKAQVEKRQD